MLEKMPGYGRKHWLYMPNGLLFLASFFVGRIALVGHYFFAVYKSMPQWDKLPLDTQIMSYG
jgi:hypothetical protein